MEGRGMGHRKDHLHFGADPNHGMGPLYLNTLYVHWEQVLFTEAAMFFTSSLDKLNTF